MEDFKPICLYCTSPATERMNDEDMCKECATVALEEAEVKADLANDELNGR